MPSSTSQQTCLSQIDVAILAGGLGTRVRAELGDTPKVLAPIGGRPFLDILLDRLRSFGARTIVLSLGYRAERVLTHLSNVRIPGIELHSVVEPEPRGTAGAIREIRTHLTSDPVLILNGDSFIDADLCALVAAHRDGASSATLLCCRVPDAARFGRIETASDPDGEKIVSFHEKDNVAGPGVINAGVYVLSQGALEQIAALDAPSLERDYFAAAAPRTFSAFVTQATFIDIGTPESLNAAEGVLAPYLTAPPA
jgi:NDP-sugar pyrophosphorylase family protein